MGEVHTDAPLSNGRPPITVAVHEFEVTVATPRLRLLRLTMNVFSRPAPDARAVRLLVPDAGAVRRIAPLPDPEARPLGEIRAGFAVPVELMDSGSFSIDLGDGRTVQLPRPLERTDEIPGRRFRRR